MNDQGKIITELCKSVGRIEGQLEGIRNELKSQNDNLYKTIEQMDDRICNLEINVQKMSDAYAQLQGKISVWAGIAGFVGSIILIGIKWLIEKKM